MQKLLGIKKANGLGYMMGEAIELRGKTYLDYMGPKIYTETYAPMANKVIGFKESIDIMRNDGYSEHQPPMVYEVLSSNGMGERKTMTKGKWKDLYSRYRLYMRQSKLPEYTGRHEA